jgi:acetyl-CoA C-acetyltransferase
LRMIYENYLQLLGRAGDRQRKNPPVFALSHNLGGMPNQNVSAIAIVGMLGA